MAVVPPQPDWLHSLLPAGGKVSLTVQQPQTGINSVANQTPMATPLAATNPTQINKSPGFPHTPTQPQPVPPNQPGGNIPSQPGAGSYAGMNLDYDASNGNWFNPYTGRQEAIPGVNAKGIITDPNAFWAYYNRYKTPVLDALAQQASKAGSWANPIDYNGIVTANADYQTGLADINLARWNAALAYGDPSVYASMGFTPGQQQAIQNNPNSVINALKRALTQQNYNANSTAAAHGAWSSGARNQDQENNALDYIRNTAQAHDQAVQQLQGFDSNQRDLFKKVKDDLESSGAFDTKDPEINQAIFKASHATVVKATDAINKLINGMSNIHSITDARNYMHAVNAALRDYAKMLTPRQKAQLQRQARQAQGMARAMAKARSVEQGGTIRQGKPPRSVPHPGPRGQAGGPGGYQRP